MRKMQAKRRMARMPNYEKRMKPDSQKMVKTHTKAKNLSIQEKAFFPILCDLLADSWK